MEREQLTGNNRLAIRRRTPSSLTEPFRLEETRKNVVPHREKGWKGKWTGLEVGNPFTDVTRGTQDRGGCCSCWFHRTFATLRESRRGWNDVSFEGSYCSWKRPIRWNSVSTGLISDDWTRRRVQTEKRDQHVDSSFYLLLKSVGFRLTYR